MIAVLLSVKVACQTTRPASLKLRVTPMLPTVAMWGPDRKLYLAGLRVRSHPRASLCCFATPGGASALTRSTLRKRGPTAVVRAPGRHPAGSGRPPRPERAERPKKEANLLCRAGTHPVRVQRLHQNRFLRFLGTSLALGISSDGQDSGRRDTPYPSQPN